MSESKKIKLSISDIDKPDEGNDSEQSSIKVDKLFFDPTVKVFDESFHSKVQQGIEEICQRYRLGNKAVEKSAEPEKKIPDPPPVKKTKPQRQGVSRKRPVVESITLSSDDDDDDKKESPIVIPSEDEAPADNKIPDKPCCSDDDDSEPREVLYRVLVKQSQEPGVWVRLREKDPLQKVFNHMLPLIGCEFTLVRLENKEPVEIDPKQTMPDLGMTPNRCLIVSLLVLSKDKPKPEYVIKIKTTDRRQTREIPCLPTDTFREILQRYCDLIQLSMDEMKFEFDGDRVRLNDTPAKIGMDNGDQIEAIKIEKRSNISSLYAPDAVKTTTSETVEPAAAARPPSPRPPSPRPPSPRRTRSRRSRP